MSPAPRDRLRLFLPLAVAVGLALGAGLSARAAAKPLTPEEQARVDRAIDKAVAFLKRGQSKNGAWQPYGGAGENPVGETLLPALALLEGGAPADDPAVRKAADLVRGRAAKLHKTYEVALAVLFFDRLGDPADEKLIRSLALRLVAGQCRTGGWCYPCPTLSAENEKAFAELLPRLQGDGAAEKADVPKQFKLLTLAQPPSQRAWRDPLPLKASTQLFTGRTDNSNTQFALLALWAARRHGVPVGATLRLAVERFERSQNADGSWNYRFHPGGGPPEPRSRSMTAAGALALAVGHALDGPAAPRPQLTLALAALAREVGPPTGQWKRRVPMTDVYFLWSLERTAVLFDLPQIADRDSYRWGAEALLTNQTERGDWGKWAQGPRDAYPTYGPVANTSFALLFLKRAHLSKDLTATLPFKPEALNAGVAARLQGGAFPTRPLSPGDSPKKP
jgi:hypothetical protein